MSTKNYSAGQVEANLLKKISFGRLTEGGAYFTFLKRALFVCPSNALLAKITGLSEGTVSVFRSAQAKINNQIPKGKPYSLKTAYNTYMDAIIALATELKMPINHKGYYGMGEGMVVQHPSSAKPAAVKAEALVEKTTVKPAAPVATVGDTDVYTAMEAAKRLGAKVVTVGNVRVEF